MADESYFLGTGWSFPPEFDSSGINVRMVTGDADITQSLGIILSTTMRERIMHPDYGCDINRFLFGDMDKNLISGIKSAVSDALLRYETRIEVNDINIDESEAGSGILLISIEYTIKTTNSRYNMVYPFYVNESSGNEFINSATWPGQNV